VEISGIPLVVVELLPLNARAAPHLRRTFGLPDVQVPFSGVDDDLEEAVAVEVADGR